jgi:hypothetical protein
MLHSTTDENIVDLDRVGTVLKLQAKLVEKKYRSFQNLELLSLSTGLHCQVFSL